jgi:hypothetical protein
LLQISIFANDVDVDVDADAKEEEEEEEEEVRRRRVSGMAVDMAATAIEQGVRARAQAGGSIVVARIRAVERLGAQDIVGLEKDLDLAGGDAGEHDRVKERRVSKAKQVPDLVGGHRLQVHSLRKHHIMVRGR